jgi:hypothetical protein
MCLKSLRPRCVTEDEAIWRVRSTSTISPEPTMTLIRPADSYKPVGDLWIISSFFNANGYRTKLQNYERFIRTIDLSGLNWLVVECAFGDMPFALPESPSLIRVTTRDIMWQKERLLNIALSRLPPDCAKVAWLDCDVLFENSEWAVQASRMLDTYPVVQLFDKVIRLPRGHAAFSGEGDAWDSFASVYRDQPNRLLVGDFASHGHSGFGWAARREVLLEHGLYDACISGSGDHMMAHAFCGDWESPCIDRILGENNPHREHFSNWCRRVYKNVRARVGCVAGTLLHLWHGDIGNRRYVMRNRELAALDFNPYRDIQTNSEGCWAWASDNPALHRWAEGYYAGRKEDG